jgi:subtilisin family serine protease
MTPAAADDPPTPPPGPLAGDGEKDVTPSTTGSYIVVMKADPLVVTVGKDNLDTATADAQGAVLEASHDDVLDESGVGAAAKLQDYTNALNGFSAVMSHQQAEKIAGNSKVSMVLPDELRQLDRAVSNGPTLGGPGDYVLNKYLGLTATGGAYLAGYTGKDVIVGVIDSGIWPEHPSFADDGSYSDLGIVLDDSVYPTCDFGNTAANPLDAPFTCNNKLIGARQILTTYRALVGQDPDEFDSARDDDGHGTHTASTAAGNPQVQANIFGRNYGLISGIAPYARVIAYKGLGNLGGFTSDLAAAIDQAVADGVDVINYSVGGGANLIGADAIAYLFAADAGVAVATSASNDGPGPGTIGGPADTPWVTSVGANTQPNIYAGEIKLGNGKTLKGASVTPSLGKTQVVDAEDAGGDLCLAGTLDPAKVTGKIVLCRRGGSGRAAKSFEVYNAGGVGMVLYNNTDQDNLFTDNFWVPTVMVDYTEGAKVKAYIDAKGDNAKASLSTGGLSTFKPAPSMAIFSSRGPDPTAADVIKPDITAPGVQVLAGNTPYPDPGFTPPGELFQSIAGTSMSSPVVAGIYALMTQAHPDWSPAMMKSAIMTTANTRVKDNDRVTQAGPFAMGAGEVKPGQATKPGSPFTPGLVYDAGFFDYLAFLCDAGPDIFANPAATCANLENNGFSTDASDLNLASIGVAELAGSQTVIRTVTSVADKKVTFRPAVKAPQGYAVEVSPNKLVLNPGDSATFTVTITNVSAPIGEWRFGDLTWKGGGYSVRSPIAVSAVQIQAPANVVAPAGATSASFDVKFGYTGAYTANAHGLVPATVQNGVISQDPDQTFPSADDTAAAVQAYDFPVAGAAYARWTLPAPTANDDLDLYLVDSAGNVVAKSTNGSGADETISLTLPADDTYTLVVHGWSVPSAPLAYTLDSWIVSATPGGSMSVTSAPTSATNGQTATIAVGFPAVPAGTTELGAVSHSDATGIIGLTIIEARG